MIGIDAEDARQRPRRERLDDRHLGARGRRRRAGDEQDDEDRQVAGERRGGEEGPAPADEADRLVAEADERRAVPLDRRLVDQAPWPG